MMGCLQRSTMERCLAARAPGHFAATSQLRAASQQPPRAAAAAAAAGEMQPAFLAKKFGMSAVRWGAALGSVGLFLGYEDLPGIILESNYGVVTTWKDVAIRFGLASPPPEQ